MKKKNVLKKNHHFQSIISQNKSIISKYLVIYFRENNYGYSRYGISISKKLVSAVFRNYYKRKVRSILSRLDHDIPMDMVIIMRRPFLSLTHEKMEAEIFSILKKVNNGK